MLPRRDPTDRRFRERLAGSSLASLLLHVLFAVLLFSIVTNSSQEGATESVSGGSIVTLESRTPVVAQAPAQPQAAAPIPHAARIAPLQHPRQTQAAQQPHPPALHELAKFAPTAPPNPTPQPQATPQPNPQPTAAVFEPKPEASIPAVPSAAPTANVVAVAVTIPPTAAPTPVPSALPTARPTQRPPAPTAAPTARPQTPAPAASATAAPTAAAAAAKASAAPSASPAAATARTAGSPAPKPGVPSPSPTQGAASSATSGTAPSPGPKGQGSPGPTAGNNGKAGPAAQRPVQVRPAPTNPPTASRGAGAKSGTSVDINDKLRSLLPHNDVNPTTGTFHQPVGLNGSIEPTPPPEIVAAAKYLYEAPDGDDARVKMWVTSIRREGPVTICQGWMLRYPRSSQSAPAIGTVAHPVAGGIAIGVGGNPGGFGKPIVEANATAVCRERDLRPLAP